ncbi:MAG: hypothetical protein B7Y99_12735 [Caulobacterales bacterium 32-69-10]|nr:MAG: hypothetical protein B7Y99_12735 [Caulobacterales bacterium 32-69-10]
MPLEPAVAADLAARIRSAAATHRQIRSLVHDHPEMDMDDAYAVQHAWAEARLAEGGRLVGYKVGLTTPSVQRACAITEPAYGHLFADMVFPQGGTFPMRPFFEPRVETELAFVMKTDLPGPDCTAEIAMAAVGHIVPAIEIVDMRFLLKDEESGAARGTLDAVADNTSSALIVLGDEEFAPGAVDRRWSSAILHRNGVAETSGVAGVVLGDPAQSLAWLANALHRRGQRLMAGQVVMSGSFITPFPAAGGDRFLADFGPLGTLAVAFR